MTRPLLLDAFSCAGIGADGYRAAGYDIVCLDNDHRALNHNPHHVIQGDALRLLADPGFVREFDAIHASPPCQLFSATRQLAVAQGKGKGRAVDLLAPTLALLANIDKPWVVENVERSPLRDHPNVTRQCGSAFGLKVQRHRLFVSNVPLVGTPCSHDRFDIDPISGKPRPWGVYYSKGDNIPSGGRTCATNEHARECMGVHRATPWKYLCEALPPAYTRHIGNQLLTATEAAL